MGIEEMPMNPTTQSYTAGVVVGVPSLLGEVASSPSRLVSTLGLVVSALLAMPMLLKLFIYFLHAGSDFIRTMRGQAPLYPGESIADLGPSGSGLRQVVVQAPPAEARAPECVRPRPDGRPGCADGIRTDARSDPLPTPPPGDDRRPGPPGL